jgi:hypothetical protein
MSSRPNDQMRGVDFSLYWLPIIGLGGIAASVWFGGHKVGGLWSGYVGLICFLTAITIQIQQAITQTTTTGSPKIRVRGVTILTPNGGSVWNPVDVLYNIGNEGRSVAHITQRNFAVHLEKPGFSPKGPPSFDYETEDRSKIDIEAGKGISEQFTSKLRLSWEQQQAIRNGQIILLFNGYVYYVDDVGSSTQIFFLQRWDNATERFFTMEDPDYERPDQR